MNATAFMEELGGLYGSRVVEEFGEIIRLYDFYEGKGQLWPVNGTLDYLPTVKRTNLIKKLIKAQARFLFGRTPEFSVRAMEKENTQAAQEMTRFLNRILRENHFGDRLIRAARDCFIGKRVALRLWTDEDGLSIGFRPSLEFLYEPKEDDADKLAKIVFFYQLNTEPTHRKQRIWKQKFVMEQGRCLLSEGIYDGDGRLVESRYDRFDTGLSFIPAYVILNDGLSGDLSGESDVAELIENQNAYNRLTSDDIDALRFNLFPQRVATDASLSSLDKLVIAPGALIDLQTDPTMMDGKQASMEMLEPKFGYDDRIEHTLSRIKSDMYELLSVPDLSAEQLKGTLSSGQSIRTMYWELLCRCEEKWACWEAALGWMAYAIFHLAKRMGLASFPDIEWELHIEHGYPLPDDEETERLNDLKEVEAKVRSRRSYMEKWRIAADPQGEMERIDQTEQTE